MGLRDPVVTSALIDASRAEQVVENVACIHGPRFTQEELDAIDKITK